MSDENNSGSAAPQENSESQESKQDFVPAKAYEEVSRDMHKYKNAQKEKDAEINALKAQLKAQEEAKLQENQQWEEIAKRREAELEEAKTKYSQQSSRFNQAIKRTALRQELGGKVKEEYLQFANLDAIQMDEDGVVDSESLRNAANEFRKEHGQLIPQDQKEEITGHDSSINDLSNTKPVSEMTADELVANYAKLKQAK
jgi:hypothetical protein